MRVLSGLALTLVLASAVNAQDGALAQVDMARLGVEDVVQLTLTLQGAAASVDEVSLPPLENLRVVGGPSVSTQVSFVNGAVSQSKSLTYALTPLAEGTARIGAFRIRDWTTEPIDLEVVAGQLRPDRPRRRSADPFGWDPFGEDPFERLGTRRRREEPRLRVDVEVEPGRVHVGEPVVATYYVDTQIGISDIQLVDAPQYPGFWTEDLDRPEVGPNGSPIEVDGESYRRFPILRKLLFPTRAGELTLPEARFRLSVARQSFFDFAAEGIERATPERKVRVDALPDDPDFSGAVGRFEVDARLDRDSVALGEAVTLRFRVSGTGNLKWVDAAPTLALDGARVYPPEAKSDLRIAKGGMQGSKTWEFVVVPETAGKLELPSLSFRYFDPRSGAMATAVTAPLALDVQAGSAGSSSGLAATRRAAPREGLALRAGHDPPAVRWAPSSRQLGLAVALLLVLHAALPVATALQEAARRRSGHRSPRRNLRQALADLDKASRHGTSKEAAAAAIERALHDVFGPLDGDRSGEAERAASALMEEVQFLRYAPQLGDYSERIHATARRAADIVRRFG